MDDGSRSVTLVMSVELEAGFIIMGVAVVMESGVLLHFEHNSGALRRFQFPEVVINCVFIEAIEMSNTYHALH